jgi:hypothetical protein
LDFNHEFADHDKPSQLIDALARGESKTSVMQVALIAQPKIVMEKMNSAKITLLSFDAHAQSDLLTK